MNHSQRLVKRIKAEATLFSRGVDGPRPAFAISDFETSPGFHDPKDSDETFGDSVFGGDFLSESTFSFSEFDRPSYSSEPSKLCEKYESTV